MCVRERERERERADSEPLGSYLLMSLRCPSFLVSPIQESPDHKTYFVKVHASHECLLKGAEDLLLRMPIEVWEGHDYSLSLYH